MNAIEKEININNIIWINTNMEWVQRVIYESNKIEKDIEMEYLSMGALRYDNNYFVGYLFDQNNLECPINIVSYIQYKKQRNELVMNYLEVSKKYRGRGVSKLIINNFFNTFKDEIKDNKLNITVTNLSKEGKKAGLKEKIEYKSGLDVSETNKRNVI